MIRPFQMLMLQSTSPVMRTRSDSRQNEIWPAVCPGVSITVKVPTWSPSRNCLRDGMRRTGPEPADRPGEPVPRHPRHDLAGRFHRVSVSVSAPERNPELCANRVARTLVVRVGVRQGVEGDRAATQAAHDAAGVESRGRVDQDRSQRDRR